MSSYRERSDATSYDSYRARTGDRRTYHDSDHYRRQSPPGRYHSPHDQPGVREWDTRERWDRGLRYKEHDRGRSRSPRGPRRQFRDRDREGYRSPSYDSRSRSRSPRGERPPYYGGPPSREVILEGLPLSTVEDDISKELKQYYEVEDLDDVRVIRDRQTKISRGFGFLRFTSLESARIFMERNYPTIHLHANNTSNGDNEAAKVRIAFSRERDDRNREKPDSEWVCKICAFSNFATRVRCHRCQTPQSDMANFSLAVGKPSNYTTSGASDASPDGTPSQFLLLRGLEPTVTEDIMAKGVTKLYKPSRMSPPPATGNTKKAKVASTTGDANLGAKEGTLRRVLLVRSRKTNESWRYGFAEFDKLEDAQAAMTRYNSFEKFTISSKPVTVDYVHAGIFVPVSDTGDSERFTFSPLANAATKLAYWDDEAFVSELTVSRKAAPAKGSEQVSSASDLGASAAEKQGLLIEPSKEIENKSKKRKADASAAGKQTKMVPSHLQFWSNRHAELHGVAQESSVGNTTETKSSTSSNEVVSSSKDAPLPAQTFADPTKNCCYLCSRQFKTAAEVNKHERLSQLHRDNLQKSELVSKAEIKMAKAGASTTPSAAGNTEYRDRAKERRAAFGASKKISLPMKKSAPLPEDDDGIEPEAAAAQSKGASLLGKMGWSAGEGLGAQGTGRIETIATDMYVQGVGLGAQGGKLGDAVDEADRNTKSDYGDFLARTRDKAKERFESM